MGKKWNNPPVIYTVAQVRFNEILSMESFVPQIQEALRNIGYPDFKKEVSNSVSVTIGPDGQPSPAPVSQQLSRFVFGDEESTSGFLLDTNSLSFQAIDYDIFETFLGTFMKALEIIHKNAAISFIERVGIRYVDAVIPPPNEDLSFYLRSEVLGVAFDYVDKLSYSYTESMFKENSDSYVTKVMIHNNHVGLPHDLAHSAYKVKSDFTSQKCLHAIIDTDGFHDVRMKFKIESISQKINDLHENIVTSFKSLCTERGLDHWENG